MQESRVRSPAKEIFFFYFIIYWLSRGQRFESRLRYPNFIFLNWIKFMGGNVKILQLCKTYELIMKEKEWLTINLLKINVPRRVRTYVTMSYHELEKNGKKYLVRSGLELGTFWTWGSDANHYTIEILLNKVKIYRCHSVLLCSILANECMPRVFSALCIHR